MKFPTFLAVIASVVLLAACGSPASRIADKQSTYDSYSPEVKSKISAGQVDVGFTMEQVMLAIGKPARKSTRTTEKGASEVWAYTKTAPTFSFGIGGGFGLGGSGFGGVGVGTSTGDGQPDDKLRLVFENGKVVTIEQAVK